MSQDDEVPYSDDVFDELQNFDNRELKGFRTTIQEDIRNLLIDSNVDLEMKNRPKLTIVVIASIYSQEPCSSCKESLSNLLTWATENDNFNGEVRILVVDSSKGFDDKKIWRKLKISFDDVPLALFFNQDQCLIDIVQGVMQVSYLDTFWSEYF